VIVGTARRCAVPPLGFRFEHVSPKVMDHASSDDDR
jgi:hypothetical protein